MNQWNTQVAIYQRLTSYAPLAAFVDDRVYDDVPQDSTYPYVVIGEEDSTEYNDDVNTGADSDLAIHVWDRPSEAAGGPQGRRRAKQILQTIYDALNHYELHITGADSILIYAEYQNTFLDPDGITRHGVIRFRLLTTHS